MKFGGKEKPCSVPMCSGGTAFHPKNFCWDGASADYQHILWAPPWVAKYRFPAGRQRDDPATGSWKSVAAIGRDATINSPWVKSGPEIPAPSVGCFGKLCFPFPLLGASNLIWGQGRFWPIFFLSFLGLVLPACGSQPELLPGRRKQIKLHHSQASLKPPCPGTREVRRAWHELCSQEHIHSVENLNT